MSTTLVKVLFDVENVGRALLPVFDRDGQECPARGNVNREQGTQPTLAPALLEVARSNCVTLAKTKKRARRGFTLLEVILSLAILTSAIAVLGELARISFSNADYTQKLTKAQLLCEGKLAEITSGITLPSPVTGVSFESEMGDDASSMIDPDEAAWLYSIESDLIDENGLLRVTVSVYQDLPAQRRPVSCRLVRWMVDPSSSGTGDGFSDDSSSESM